MSTAVASAVLPIAPAAAADRQELVVSVHDVAPPSRERCHAILRDLAKRGVDRCALLVVPNYHHHGEISSDKTFTTWLRELQADGNEIVIHGYFHERPRGAAENPWTTAVTRLYTAGEGEFYDLPYDEAYRRITKARQDFTAAGLHARGFIAPAWLLGREAERAARDAEIEYTTRLSSVRDLRTNDRFPSQSLVYSTRSSWRRTSSWAWNGTLFALIRRQPLLRISIHPPDHDHPEIWDQILRLVGQAAHEREVTTYAGWIAQRRLRRGDP